jgi:hypothetical protein
MCLSEKLCISANRAVNKCLYASMRIQKMCFWCFYYAIDATLRMASYTLFDGIIDGTLDMSTYGSSPESYSIELDSAWLKLCLLSELVSYQFSAHTLEVHNVLGSLVNIWPASAC